MSQTDDHRARVQKSRARWLQHRQILEAYRVRPDEKRTTPPAPFSITKVFPELAARTVTTVRLHPRFGEEPSSDCSKLGGTFLWPPSEPWPVCRAHEIPLVTVLQLRADDFPEMPFPPGKDLFQMLWCPREHDEIPECLEKPCPMYWADPKFVWRDSREISRHETVEPPQSQDVYYEYVPLPCRLLPERVLEYPSTYDLNGELADRIQEWEDDNLGADGKHIFEYEAELSVAPGTKLGGYLHWIQFPWAPACRCGQAMEHLLTIDSGEFDSLGDSHWTPFEDREILRSFPRSWEQRTSEQQAICQALTNPTGLELGDLGHMQLFVCRHCESRPIEAGIEN